MMQNKKIGFFHAYGALWKYYADFSSRTSKEAFWKAWTVHNAILLVLILPTYSMYQSIIERADVFATMWLIPCVIYSIATIIPHIALILRRLHDIDRRGRWFFLYLIPVAGQVIFFIMLSRSSAPFDVFPGRSGSGPYTGYASGQQQDAYGQARDPQGQPQNAYAQSQDIYGETPYIQPNGSHVQPQSPYGQNPYAQQGRPYGQNPYAQGSPYGQNPYGQGSPYGQNSYAQQGSPYGQNSYAKTSYAGWRYAESPYQGTPTLPRRYAPQAGGNSAAAAITLSIALAVCMFVYNVVCNVYFQENSIRYYENLLGVSASNPFMDDFYDYDGGNDPWSDAPYDYGYGDDYWDDYGDGYSNGDGDDYNSLTEDEQAALDAVRGGKLEGFPDFTIEEVLLSGVDPDGLDWSCVAFDGYDGQAYSVAAFGYLDGSFEYILTSFDLYDDGSIKLYSFSAGDRSEYDEDAIDLYKEWYDRILPGGDNTDA